MAEVSCRVCFVVKNKGLRTFAVFLDAQQRAKHLLRAFRFNRILEQIPIPKPFQGEHIIRQKITSLSLDSNPALLYHKQNETKKLR